MHLIQSYMIFLRRLNSRIGSKSRRVGARCGKAHSISIVPYATRSNLIDCTIYLRCYFRSITNGCYIIETLINQPISTRPHSAQNRSKFTSHSSSLRLNFNFTNDVDFSVIIHML